MIWKGKGGVKYGQMYVVLSRVTSTAGMCLIGSYKSTAIKADPTVTTLQPVECIHRGEDSLTVTLLNTRSLHEHAIDILNDEELMESDLLMLTETQLLPDQSVEVMESTLCDLNMLYNNSLDKYQSLAICLRDSVILDDSMHSPGVSKILFKKSNLIDANIKLVLLYRKQSWLLPSFIDDLKQLLYDDIDIIMGDFNIDAFKPNKELVNVLSNYKLIIQSATHLSGGQIDHIYIKKALLDMFHVDSTVHIVHFTDHDALKFKLTRKNT